MSDDKEKLLREEMENYEEQLKVLAGKLQELAGTDCSFGSCVFDPAMKDTEEKIAEVQRRKKVLDDVMKALKECGIE